MELSDDLNPLDNPINPKSRKTQQLVQQASAMGAGAGIQKPRSMTRAGQSISRQPSAVDSVQGAAQLYMRTPNDAGSSMRGYTTARERVQPNSKAERNRFFVGDMLGMYTTTLEALKRDKDGLTALKASNKTLHDQLLNDDRNSELADIMERYLNGESISTADAAQVSKLVGDFTKAFEVAKTVQVAAGDEKQIVDEATGITTVVREMRGLNVDVNAMLDTQQDILKDTRQSESARQAALHAMVSQLADVGAITEDDPRVARLDELIAQGKDISAHDQALLDSIATSLNDERENLADAFKERLRDLGEQLTNPQAEASDRLASAEAFADVLVRRTGMDQNDERLQRLITLSQTSDSLNDTQLRELNEISQILRSEAEANDFMRLDISNLRADQRAQWLSEKTLSRKQALMDAGSSLVKSGKAEGVFDFVMKALGMDGTGDLLKTGGGAVASVLGSIAAYKVTKAATGGSGSALRAGAAMAADAVGLTGVAEKLRGAPDEAPRTASTDAPDSRTSSTDTPNNRSGSPDTPDSSPSKAKKWGKRGIIAAGLAAIGFGGYKIAFDDEESGWEGKRSALEGDSSAQTQPQTQTQTVQQAYTEREGISPQRQQFENMAAKAEYDNNLPTGMLRALIEQESRYNPTAQSSAGAMGLAQIVPKWHPNVDPLDPDAAIPYAGKFLRQMYDQTGDWQLALAAYNAGIGNVRKYNNTIPPFEETQKYVPSVLEKMEKYSDIPYVPMVTPQAALKSSEALNAAAQLGSNAVAPAVPMSKSVPLNQSPFQGKSEDRRAIEGEVRDLQSSVDMTTLGVGGAALATALAPSAVKSKVAEKAATSALGTGALKLGSKALKAIPFIGTLVSGAIDMGMGIANADAAFDTEDPTLGQYAASGFGGLVEGLTFGLLDGASLARKTHEMVSGMLSDSSEEVDTVTKQKLASTTVKPEGISVDSVDAKELVNVAQSEIDLTKMPPVVVKVDAPNLKTIPPRNLNPQNTVGGAIAPQTNSGASKTQVATAPRPAQPEIRRDPYIDDVHLGMINQVLS